GGRDRVPGRARAHRLHALDNPVQAQGPVREGPRLLGRRPEQGAMIVLGIDPGIRHVGWGLIAIDRGERPVYVDHGVIELDYEDPNGNAGTEHRTRVTLAHRELRGLYEHHRPAEIAAE